MSPVPAFGPLAMWKRQMYADPGDSANDPSTDESDDPYYSWWWSPAGMAVRYSIIAVLFGSVFLYLLIGYFHARSRLQKNLEPLPYHRWMVRRAYPPVAYSQYQPYPNNGPNQAYAMSNYPPPPPAYNPADAPPPVYQPPQGATKIMADQSYAGPSSRARTDDAEAEAESQHMVPPSSAR